MWAQNVAKIGDTEYETLQAAIEAATEGQTVELIADAIETESYSIDGKHITIDFSEYTVTASHSNGSAKVFSIASTGGLTLKGTTGGFTDNTVYGIFYNQGTLTVEGGHYSTTVDDYGVIFNEGGTCTVSGGTLTGAYAAIYAKGINSVTVSNGTINGAYIGIQANAGTTLDITGGTITATNQSKKYPGLYLVGTGTSATVSGGIITGWDGVSVRDHATLTVNTGATINAKNAAIIGNGNEDQGNTTITINGGTMTSDDTGIYHPQIGGRLTINGGTITGAKLGVEIRAGELSVTGGTITAGADTYSCVANNNGTTTIGAALAIAQHTTKQNIAVNISGGTFTGVKALSESNPEANDPAPHVDLSVSDGDFHGGIAVTDVQGGFISGGTYSEAVPAEYCVTGKAPYVDEHGACTIITPATEVPADAEALANGSYYKFLDNAITNAGTTATEINVLRDPTADAIIIHADANITLTVADEVTLEKPITNSGTLTITSGTISGAITSTGNLIISGGEISGDISNTAALTITSGTFTGNITNTNPGTVAISGGTHTQLPVAAFCATGYMPVKNAESKYIMTIEWRITDETKISDFSHLTSSAAYSVATATYHRNTGMIGVGSTSGTQYGTICLPFEIKAAPTPIKLYTATEITASTLTITEVTDFSSPIPAGTPLIFELSAAAEEMTVTSSSAGVSIDTPTDPADGNLLRGTYSAQTITTGLTNIYYLNGDKFHQAKVSLKVPAFRAYLDTTTSPSPAPSMLSIAKEGDDETTGIQQVEALETVTEVYDLSGRKLNGLQRGINILRRADGSSMKVIVK